MSRKLLILLALAGLATACHKDDAEPTIDFGPNNGFTVRLGNNMPGAQIDPTDWTSDPSWNTKEQALFAKLNLPLAAPQLAAGTLETTTYPTHLVQLLSVSWCRCAGARLRISMALL